MVFPVAVSAHPLVFDTLPALKVCHYYGEGKNGNIYCYGKLYFLGENLQLALYSFERQPDECTRMEFAIGKRASSFLLLSLSRDAARLSLCAGGQEETLETSLEPVFFGGMDEQGWYWGAQLSLDKRLLARAGVSCEDGEFSAGLLKTRTDTEAFGASFPAMAESPFQFKNFGRFRAIAY